MVGIGLFPEIAEVHKIIVTELASGWVEAFYSARQALLVCASNDQDSAAGNSVAVWPICGGTNAVGVKLPVAGS